MTIIQKIKIQGFKSFPKLIEIPLEKDFSIILGPNGSGKSNVVDAVCFVFGRLSAKSMRAENISSLIYNGGKKYNPSKYAEVSIFFDNSKNEFPIKDKTIKISRIVKQSGNSIYKINDEVRTRQQVLDLLSSAKIDPEGHNIILQGDIAKFMEMKPEERRQIIEEIAGISMYEEKKEKALHELDKVQEKLKEAEIILTERETNLRELKKDRDQAKKYKELNEKIKDNKATFLNIQIKEKSDKKTELEKKSDELSKKLQEYKDKINNFRDDINKKHEEIKNINIEIEEKGEKDQLVLRKQIDDLKTSIIKHESRIETLKSEINKIEQRRIQLKENIDGTEKDIQSLKDQKKELLEKIKTLNLEQSNIEKEINAFKQKHGIKDLSDYKTKIDEFENKIEEASKEIQEVHNKKQELIREKDKIEFKINDIDEKLNKINNLKKEDADKLNNLKNLRQEFKKITLDLNKLLEEDSAFSAQLQNARKNLIRSNEEFSILRSRRMSIKDNLSQDNAIKRILGLKNKKIHGTISDLAEVPSKYSLALEISAGHRMKSIVVEDDETAAQCIKILKDEKLGIATFLPLNKIKSSNINSAQFKTQGVHGLALDLINFNPKYKNAFSYVFGNTLVVEDTDIARKIGVGRVRMVSLDGTLLETSGAMIGGYRRLSIGFNEKETSSKIQELEKEISRLDSIIKHLEDKKLNNEQTINDLRLKKINLETDIIRIEKTSGITEDDTELKKQKVDLTKEEKNLVSVIEGLTKKHENLEKSLSLLKQKKFELTSSITKPSVSKDLATLEEKRDSIKTNIFEINGNISNLDNQIEKIFLPEIERIKKIIKDQEKEKDAFSNELKDLQEILNNKKQELKSNENKEKEFYGKFKNLATKRNKLQADIQKSELNINTENERSRSIEQKINDISIDKAKIIAEFEALNRELEPYKDGKIRRGVPIDELKLEIKEFEKLVQNLGSVNLRALEIYENLEQEHKKLLEKVAKLKLEKDDVLEMIKEIEGKKKDLFMQTFNEIANSFKNIHSSLSTKGEAYLELENKEDPLSAGLDIKVKIARNKYLDVKSLSGGEKTLSALSFIFAIQEYQPASFYLLDEVDAALDKHNSEKLSQLIKKYSQNAQYIVISHNDAIITEASKVYGVSMQDGISKIVSLKI